jgi:RNA polymerase sigma-70 factor, ECF subfamily
MLLAAILGPSASAHKTRDPASDGIDAALMARFREGDESAFEELLHRHWKFMVRYAYSFLGDLDAAEDIVQESFVRLWQNRVGWKGSGTVRAYAYRIARNLALQENEKREVRIRFQLAEQVHEAGATPAEELERKRFRMAVHAAVDALSPRRREILILARFHDLTYNQIAEVMGIASDRGEPDELGGSGASGRAEAAIALVCMGPGPQPGSPRNGLTWPASPGTFTHR